MNRQTLAVTIGTVALVVVGGVLMYSTPSTMPTQKPGISEEDGASKSKTTKSKGKAPKRLGPGKLIHVAEPPKEQAAAPEGAPNVVLVVLSAQRRDQWTPYASAPQDPPATPFLASVAEQGVLMTDALTVAVNSREADAAILTGRYPHHVGMIEPSEKQNNRDLPAEAETLAERLSAAGWHTVGLSANHDLNAKAGMAQGFDWYRDSQPFSLMLDMRIDAATLVNIALQRVAARSEEQKARPMFLQLAFVDSHKPIKVPPAEFKPFTSADSEVAPYLATLKRQDDAIAKLVEGLAAEGMTAENTLFVVVADHGEGLNMPVHHRQQHGFVLYDSSVRIPWMWWGKGIPAGGKVDGLASLVDLPPTLLHLAGIEGQQGFDGLDLSAAVLGKGPSPRTEAYADSLYEGMHRASVWTTARQCQKDYGSSKQLEDDQFENACYDRAADPTFVHPIEDPDLAAKLDQMHNELMGAIGG